MYNKWCKKTLVAKLRQVFLRMLCKKLSKENYSCDKSHEKTTTGGKTPLFLLVFKCGTFITFGIFIFQNETKNACNKGDYDDN